MKSLATSVLISIIIVLFSACTTATASIAKEVPETEIHETTILETEIPETKIPKEEECISYYINEMMTRGNIDFLEQESKFYAQHGYEFRGSKLKYDRKLLYNPVLLEKEESTYILYTDNEGTFFVRDAQTFELIYNLGNIHHNPEKNTQIIEQNFINIRIYYPERGVILGWHYGESIEEETLPEKAKYVGCSLTEGDLFLSDTNNVYSVNCGYIKHLAKDVVEVLETNYCVSELTQYEAFEPVFRMLDNTKKVYISGEGNDDESHLFSIN